MLPPNATGRYEQSLFFFEEPEIVVIDLGNRSKVVAVSTRNIGGNGYFGAKVSIAQFRHYLEERFDLRYLMLRPDRWTWYEFLLPADPSARVQLTNVELNRARIENFIPEQGFFSREHTEAYRGFQFEKRDIQRFEVDGQWSMNDFGRLHSQIADLYALTKSVDAFADAQTPQNHKRDIVESFVKPFRGGGSYLSLFRSLAKAGGEDARPDIKAIQWASPGYIDVVGDADAFDRLISLVDHYSQNEVAIKSNYDHLWSYLQETGLLKRSLALGLTQPYVVTEIENRARQLGSVLGVTSYPTLLSMAGGDALVSAKALLAASRRIEKLFRFFVEGRVSVQGTTIG
ncbi:hypothetical protein [Sphingomonas sp. 1185]|uniref:hypothetical protein n=1 Tax=Sphingomonas sp. 1185 TaxID=3156411 RepID=UPI003395F6E2